MSNIPVTNTSDMPLFVAGVMIPAGETRHFAEHHVPAHLRPVEQGLDDMDDFIDSEEINDELLLDLLKASSKEVIEAMDDLETEHLVLLAKMEEEGQARKNLLPVIHEEILSRAADDNDQE